MSDIDTGVVDSLKALDPRRPMREADKEQIGFGDEFAPSYARTRARGRLLSASGPPHGQIGSDKECYRKLSPAAAFAR